MQLDISSKVVIQWILFAKEAMIYFYFTYVKYKTLVHIVHIYGVEIKNLQGTCGPLPHALNNNHLMDSIFGGGGSKK